MKVKKKIIDLVWNPPPMTERFDGEIFKIHTENGFIKLVHKTDGPIRIIPTAQLILCQFQEIEEESPILRPSLVTPGSVTPGKEPS